MPSKDSTVVRLGKALRKFNNFLQRMKKLNVIRSGEVQGEYTFNLRMVRLYIWLDSLHKDQNIKPT
jgi:hypothetical protein